MNSCKCFTSLRQPFMLTLLMMLLCGLVFPLLLQGISTLLFPEQAAGSLVMVDGKAVGVRHVGQEFTRDYFMKCRPSAVRYNTFSEDKDGKRVYSDGSDFSGPSSGSANYAPSNPALAERVKADIETFLAAHPGVKKEDIPTDLLTASASGLDPHISPASAAVQLPAIAKASGLSMEKLESIVKDNTEGRLLGIFGEKRVHVLGVNIAIAQAMGLIH